MGSVQPKICMRMVRKLSSKQSLQVQILRKPPNPKILKIAVDIYVQRAYIRATEEENAL